MVKGPDGDRLETVWEFRPRFGGLWRELSIRTVAHRQMYTFTLNVDEDTYPTAKGAFDLLVDSAEISAPNTGADPIDPKANRWVQREFKFAIDLPEGWRPVLAPDQAALFFANGPAHGIWSDNVLVLARPHRDLDLKGLERTLPEELREAEPGCEVLSCRVIPQGKGEALETVVRTRRGPFSMTVLERRFRGGRYDYEVKYTVESKRFDELAPDPPQEPRQLRRGPRHHPRGAAGVRRSGEWVSGEWVELKTNSRSLHTPFPSPLHSPLTTHPSPLTSSHGLAVTSSTRPPAL